MRGAACGPFRTVLGPGADADHTDHARSVIQWLVDHQDDVLNELRPALIEMYQWMKDVDPGPDEQIWFPDGSAEDLAPDRFNLKRVSIVPDRSGIIFWFETPSGHYEEHGCMALLVNGKLATFGPSDNLLDSVESGT